MTAHHEAEGSTCDVSIRWGERVALRDGTGLSATIYLPVDQSSPAPSILTMTPYIAQTYHDRGLYFASRGFPFIAVDVRGRGNSEGEFRPNLSEGPDGYDVVEWIAEQPFCNGKVAMWGGSYAGHDQWTTAAQRPPHLATIVPVAAPKIGVDYPIRNNIAFPYWVQWLTLVAGRTSQDRIFHDIAYWNQTFARWTHEGRPFAELDSFVGNPSEIFQNWVSAPAQGEFWDQYNPTPEQYQGIQIPVLTITGMYDDDQPGALAHLRDHLGGGNGRRGPQAGHCVVIGPWDHDGTRTPRENFSGVQVGPASLVDLGQLHIDWYRWTMADGPRPAFLEKDVAWYVMGADRWRYVDRLEDATARHDVMYLHADQAPDSIDNPGALGALGRAGSDSYIYDPTDTKLAVLERTIDPEDKVNQQMVRASARRHLVYETSPLSSDMEISGFFQLDAWISIDQPDTDLRASIYSVAADSETLLLTFDTIRARYRESLRAERLINTTEPLLYRFDGFTFVSTLLRAGQRLRLIIGPNSSIHVQRNYNSGGTVAEESHADARSVRVSVHRGGELASRLFIPVGAVE